MFRRKCNVNILDRIINEFIRESLSVTTMSGKMRENILRWFRYTEKRNNEDIVKNIGEMREGISKKKR